MKHRDWKHRGEVNRTFGPLPTIDTSLVCRLQPGMPVSGRLGIETLPDSARPEPAKSPRLPGNRAKD